MNEKKRIACFFTTGYTELNAMKLFMRKINENAEYPPLSYSKKIQGEEMLERIVPFLILDKCPVFFRDAAYALQNLSENSQR